MEVTDLRTAIEHMPTDLAAFSVRMRLLYARGVPAVKSRKLAVKSRKLRHDITIDAMVYFESVFPISAKFVADIRRWFKYFKALDYEKWSDNLKDILEETTGYKKRCETIVAMHKDILVPLKQRHDEAKLIVGELKDLQSVYERTNRELEESASNKTRWAVGLFFVPIVNFIATPILDKEAEIDAAKAVAHGAQAKIHEAAAPTIQDILIPAIQSFIDGMYKAAGFFKIMEVELGKFEGKAEKSLEAKKKLHYKMMNAEAKKMDAACKMFCGIIPKVETELKAIPTEGTGKTYVDRWLQRQIKIENII